MSMTILILIVIGVVAAIVGYVFLEHKLNPTSTAFDKIRHSFELVLLVGVVVLIIFLFMKPSSIVTLPGGQKITIPDYSQYLKDITTKLKKIDDLGKQINNLESSVRKTNTALSNAQIPEALKETDIKKSVERMKDQW